MASPRTRASIVSQSWSVPVFRALDKVWAYNLEQAAIVRRLWCTWLDLAVPRDLSDQWTLDAVQALVSKMSRVDMSSLLDPERLYSMALLSAVGVAGDTQRIKVMRLTSPPGR